MAEITVNHPGNYNDQAMILDRAKMKLELDHMRERNETLSHLIDQIFDGIARGEQVELVYKDGTTRTITRAKPRGEKEPPL